MCNEKQCATHSSLMLMVNYSHCNPQPVLGSEFCPDGYILLWKKEGCSLDSRSYGNVLCLGWAQNLQSSGNSERPKSHKALPAIINTLTTGREESLLVELSVCCIWHLEDKAFTRCHRHCDGLWIVQLSVSHLCSCKKPITHDPLSELDKVIGSPS